MFSSNLATLNTVCSVVDGEKSNSLRLFSKWRPLLCVCEEDLVEAFQFFNDLWIFTQISSS